MPRPLIIYHYVDVNSELTEHEYTANRVDFNVDDVRNARVIEVKKSIPETKNGAFLPRFLIHEENGELYYNYFRPYPKVTFGSRIRPQQGIGTAFDVKIYEHLLTKMPAETVVKHDRFATRQRRDMLEHAGVTLNQTTLKEHFDAFKCLAEANRRKNEVKRSE